MFVEFICYICVHHIITYHISEAATTSEPAPDASRSASPVDSGLKVLHEVDFEHERLKAMVRHLDEKTKVTLKNRFINAKKLGISLPTADMFAGCGQWNHKIKELVRAIAVVFELEPPDVPNKYVTESNQRLRAQIDAAFKPELMLGSTGAAANQCCVDVREAGTPTTIPDTTLAAAGWPCTDVSRLNPNQHKNRQCIVDRSGASGSGFQELCDVLEKPHAPMWTLGETVDQGTNCID